MSLSKRRYTYVDFTTEKPVPIFAKVTHAVVTAADTQQDFFRVGGNYFEFIQTGANTLFAANGFVHTATGWKVSLDATDADAIQITQGIIAGVATPMKFTTGTDSFFLKVKLIVTDLNETDVVMIGFRELAAYEATTTPGLALTDYDHKALIGVMDNAGQVKSHVSTAGGADTAVLATATPVVTATAVTWEVRVNADLTVDWLVNDAADALLTAGASVVTTAKVLIPTILIVSTGAADGGAVPDVQLVTYECGLL